jgi:hypothetical protein
MSYFVVDDFLPEEDYRSIRDIITGNEFPWYLQDIVTGGTAAGVDEDDDPLEAFLTHYFYSGIGTPIGVRSNFYDACCVPVLKKPLLGKLSNAMVVRIKANCYPRTETLRTHKFHVDHTFPHDALLVSFSDNDGYTLLKTGEKIESAENRALFTTDSLFHASTNCTNLNCRINLNITFIGVN